MIKFKNPAFQGIVLVFTICILSHISATAQSESDSISPAFWREKLSQAKENFTEVRRIFNRKSEFKNLRYGVFGGLNYNMHNAQFKWLDTIPCCAPENFGSQSGFSYYLGAVYEYPLSESFNLGISGGLNNLSAILKQNEDIKYSQDGSEKTGISEHSLDISLNMAYISPYINYRFTEAASISAGFDLGYIVSEKYSQKEELKVDDNYTWGNNSTIRNERSGEIPKLTKFGMFLTAGINYEFPFKLTSTKNFFISPELKIGYPLQNVTSSLDWTITQIKVGVAIKFSPYDIIKAEDFEEIKREFELDTSEIALNLRKAEQDSIYGDIMKTVLNVKITKIASIDENGDEIEIKKLMIDQYSYSRTFPLLQYIFFNDGEYEINPKYEQLNYKEILSFKEDDMINRSNIDIYYDILNIIGSRMLNKLKKKRNLILTIVGCNSDEGIESNNKELSRRRAESVKKYLKVWRIPDKNIKIETRNLPEKYTSSIDEKGKEENRRVEFYCNDDEILKPIEIDSSLFSIVKPEKIRTYMEVIAGAGLKQWIFKIEDPLVGLSLINEDYYTKAPLYLDWDFKKEKKLPTKSCRLAMNLFVYDSLDKYAEAPIKNLDVEVNSVEEKISKGKSNYRLLEYTILLPFDDPGLDPNSKMIVSEIKNDIQLLNSDDLVIDIKGYTDILGTGKINIELANSRAKRVADFLKYQDIIYSGEGVSDKYDNGLPEGRFYNRSVDIKINVK
ncbi:OmpA family protein [Bacteroidota bacterium]